MIPKKILIVTRYFWPDKTPESLILNSISEYLGNQGHEIDVLSSYPSYGSDFLKIDFKKIEIKNSIKVIRMKLQNEIGKPFYFRVLNAIKLGLKTLFLINKKNYDIIISASNPPVIGPFFAAISSRLINSRFIYYCMDITPEVGKVSGDFNNIYLYKLLEFIDSISCTIAQPLIIHSKDMKNTLLRRKQGHKFEFKIINNFSVNSKSKSTALKKSTSRNKNKLQIIYAGNIGRFQGLETAIYEMSKIRNNKDIELLIMGNGVQKNKLVKLSKDLQANIRFIPYQNYEVAQNYIRNADLGLISLSNGVYKYAYPSKTMAYLQEGKPIIAIVEKESEIGKNIILEKYGYVISHKIENSLSNLLLYLKDNPSELKVMSVSALKKHRKSFSAEVILEKWDKIINSTNNKIN